MDAEPAELPADQIADQLQRHWSLSVDFACYVKVGHGSHHWIAFSQGAPAWFVTGDQLHGSRLKELQASARVARDLTFSGRDFVIASVADDDGNLVRLVKAHWAIQVLPYVEGTSTDQGSWTDPTEQAEAARIVGALHAVPPPDYLPTWDPTPPYRAELEAALRSLEVPGIPTSSWRDHTRTVLLQRRELIQALLDRYDALVEEIRADNDPWVLTHGEPDSDNFIRKADGSMVLIDWTSAAIAPRERDLFDVLQGPRDVLADYQQQHAGMRPARSQAMEMIGLYWRLIHLGHDVTRLLGPDDGPDLDATWARFQERLQRPPGAYPAPPDTQ